MANESQRGRLPFEPSSKKGKKAEKVEKPEKAPAKPSVATTAKTRKSSESRSSRDRASAAIPEVVNRRMLRRVAFFSGVPTALGVLIFFVSYLLLTRHIIEFPKVLVLLSTLACFGLGVVGLTYGALSASWDEDRLGGLLGFDEFSLNFKRMTGAWRDAREMNTKS